MYEPYDYQNECIEAISLERSKGKHKGLVILASGLGKTATVAFLTRKWRREGERGRILYLCHQNEILEQGQATFEKILEEEGKYGFLNGFEKNSNDADFLFASFKSMLNHLHSFAKNDFVYVYVDESHHSHADTYKVVIEYFEPEYLLGFTATVERTDEKDIQEIYGEPAYSLPLPEALARGLLAPVDYRLLTDELELEKIVEKSEQKLSLKQLNKTIFVPRRDEEIVSIIRRHTAEIAEPRVVIFCSSVAHCEQLAVLMKEAVAIHSDISRNERVVRMELFRQGLVTTVLTVDIFNEGVDIPEVNLVVFLRSTASSTVFFQQLGRGLRRSIGKLSVRVLDFVANCERISMVDALWKEVKRLYRPGQRVDMEMEEDDKQLPMTLNVHTAGFTEKIVPILQIMDRIRATFYPTWEEASKAAIQLGIKSAREYHSRYAEDPRLPSDPYKYPEFPGFNRFLDVEFYPTWQEAAAAARRLGIKSIKDYREKHAEDKRLYMHPDGSYDDFPGWLIFTGKKPEGYQLYATLEEASAATIRLGISDQRTYKQRSKEDPNLPSDPSYHYREKWQGWPNFFGRESRKKKKA